MPHTWITNPFEAWLENHPVIAWAINHPLWAIAVLLLILFLVGGLVRAVARLTEQIWLALLRLPLQLVQWILSRISNSYTQRSIGTGMLSKRSLSRSERLARILEQLETLRQQQDQLMQEVRAILVEK